MPFARPTTTATPDEIFEEWVHVLSHAELLALLYVVRRTLGFKKDADSISYTQFLHGIVTREGKVLDRGCGIKSRGTLAAALRRLEERGLIRSVKTQTAAGDQATTRYALWFVGDDERDAAANTAGEATGAGGTQTEPGWFANRTTGSARIEPRVVRPSNPQQTVETTNTKQQTVLSKRKGTAHRAAALDSTDSTVSTGISTLTPPLPETLSPVAAAVANLSDEFGDDAPQASQTRVANMQRAAGLDEAAVLPLLDEAAAIARSQAGAITKRGRSGEIVRMPYLLATLRDLVDAPHVPDAPLASGAGRPDPHLSGAGPGPGPGPGTASAPALTWPAPAGPCAPGGGATAAVAGDDPPVDSAATALWRAVLGEVREVLTPENYAVWFAPARASILEGDVLHVAVPSPFHADWLAHKLGGRVRQALERTGHGGVRIVYASAEREMSPPTGTSGVPISSPIATARPLASPGRASDGDRPPAGDRSHLMGGCPLCRAAPCRCRPAERARRVVVARAGSPAVAGRGAP